MNRTFRIITFSLIFALTAIGHGVNAEVKLPRLVSSGMVLQRDTPLKIWGWADASEKVKVVFLDKTYLTKADKKGNWAIELPAVPAGGPYVMTINHLELNDIMLGDVWLCSGQSNMELPLRRLMDLYADEIKQINNPNIRLFRSSSRTDFTEAQPDYKDGNWLKATSEHCLDFSGVAYFFAAELYQKYQVPIGLISTAIGGSPAESWLSAVPAQKYLDIWKRSEAKVDSLRKQQKLTQNTAPMNWFEALNQNDPGLAKWSKADVDVSDWPQIALPGYWTEKGVTQKMGSIWFYKEFNIPDSLVNTEGVLRLGRIIDSDSAFINGTFVGTVSYQYPPRIYKITKGVLKPGKNQLMVRVISQGAKGGFVEEKPYEVRLGSQVFDLTGQWKYHSGAVMGPDTEIYPLQFRPAGLFNGLINPALNYNLKGIIWYQGESNCGKSKEYRQLFQELIVDWRTQFNKPNLPFVFAQLANLGKPTKQPAESGIAEVRDAQRRALELPNTGMAVTFDIGEWNDIHPLNKKEVSRRLALEASRIAYGNTNMVSCGPLYQSMEIQTNSILLTFSSVGSGLYTNSLLQGFEIAGADGRFEWANAVVVSENTVKVWNDNISEPLTVRYAWSDNPEGSNLKNKEGLPASPFSTEK